MSFILDALKKSEQQRQQGDVPALQTQQAAGEGPPRRRRLWPILLTAALLLNALLLLWWLRPWQPSDRPEVSREISPPAVAPVPPAVPLLSPAPPPVPAEEPPPRPAPAPAGWADLPTPMGGVTSGPPKAGAKKPDRQASRSGTRTDARQATHLTNLPNWTELPAPVRQTLPEVSITLHYYTADPAARMARINGRMLREGETIGSNLILEAITPSEVILKSGDLRFRLGSF